MDSSGAKRRMMEEALLHHEMQNETAPPVWTDEAREVRVPRSGAQVGYTPSASEAICNGPRPTDSYLGDCAP